MLETSYIGSVDFAAEIDKERLRINAFNSLQAHL